MTDQCPTCGAAVRVETSGRASYMVPTDAERVRELEDRIRELIGQCERLRAERNAVRVKVEQPLLLRIRELEAALSSKLPERLTRDQAEPICSLTCVQPCDMDCDCNSEVQAAWAVLRERLIND